MTEFNKDHYRTPPYFFNWLNLIYEFNVDGCAVEENALCHTWIGSDNYHKDFLTFDLMGFISDYMDYPFRFFVNPPYSNIKPFVERAIELMKYGNTVVMLLPADKSTQWYKLIRDNATEVTDIIGGRISFLHPVTGEEVKGNNKGSIVVELSPFKQGFVTRQMDLAKIKEIDRAV
ncbi:phage N-6-adenine-methyltransferase [Phocoenobacter skyensis]|nr:phage N-6-adenine-methyltransferase [Pasteurella skyensis]MDP8184380.1 phage N-6-adenine-methyltransferase [Pasteurella skyensis]QLB23679.1 phage N-6-adenine-methyltransferase [Pasteurella skyensis]